MFEKKFGFSHRPIITDEYETNTLNDTFRSSLNSVKARSDKVENYFYFSSMDS